MGEVRVHPRDLHEREAHTVPSHGLQVFHLAPAEVIDDGIERDGAQTEIGGNDRYVALCRRHFFERLRESEARQLSLGLPRKEPVQ